MPIDYLLFIGGIIVVSNVTSEKCVEFIIKKFGRQSYVSMIFVVILTIALGLVIYVGIDTIKKNDQKGVGLFAAKGFCAK